VKTTLMTRPVTTTGTAGLCHDVAMHDVVVPVAAAVRERRTSPNAPLPQGTGLSVASDRTAALGVPSFAPALLDARPGPPRGAPV
jgi:hypothetical protein